MIVFSIRKMLLLFIVLEVSVASFAYAFQCDVRVGQFTDLNSLVEKIAVVGEPGQTDPKEIKDDRRTSAEYAADHGMTKEEVEKKYAGTGQVDCDNGTQSTGNLVVRDDLILVASHALFDRKSCTPLVEPNQCKFTVRVGRKKETIPVDSLVAKNFSCPGSILQTDDMVVLKLKKGIKLAEPYQIAADSDVKWPDGNPVTMVANNSMDFFPPDERRPLNEIKSARTLGYRTNFPKHYGDCQAVTPARVDSAGSRIMYHMSCDGDKGASGGGIFEITARLEDRPLLKGILNAAPRYDTRDEVDRTGQPVARPLDPTGEWSTSGIPINRDVKKYLDSVK